MSSQNNGICNITKTCPFHYFNLINVIIQSTIFIDISSHVLVIRKIYMCEKANAGLVNCQQLDLFLKKNSSCI